MYVLYILTFAQCAENPCLPPDTTNVQLIKKVNLHIVQISKDVVQYNK